MAVRSPNYQESSTNQYPTQDTPKIPGYTASFSQRLLGYLVFNRQVINDVWERADLQGEAISVFLLSLLVWFIFQMVPFFSTNTISIWGNIELSIGYFTLFVVQNLVLLGVLTLTCGYSRDEGIINSIRRMIRSMTYIYPVLAILVLILNSTSFFNPYVNGETIITIIVMPLFLSKATKKNIIYGYFVTIITAVLLFFIFQFLMIVYFTTLIG